MSDDIHTVAFTYNPAFISIGASYTSVGGPLGDGNIQIDFFRDALNFKSQTYEVDHSNSRATVKGTDAESVREVVARVFVSPSQARHLAAALLKHAEQPQTSIELQRESAPAPAEQG